MDSAKIQLADKLKAANNVLVTVSRNPSVDQLAACIGLSLMLNKFGKHAAAVFSGEVPSTIEFLKPEETLERTTDSLRDFIIALDKSKADKLRYKVEDNVVRIFITPYRTSITQDDLEFSQGDFNVDVVVALGVHDQEDLDQAITTHGRILHDATVATINVSTDGQLGGVNWNDPGASSLSELVTDLSLVLDKELLDNQIATALLTGIVAETERFRNQKTTSETMRASAALMAAGADQQLVATQLEEPLQPMSEAPVDVASGEAPARSNDGTLQIEHTGEEEPADSPELELPQPTEDTQEEHEEQPIENGDLPDVGFKGGPRMMTEPPTLGGMLTANTKPEQLDPSTDPLSAGNRNKSPLLSRSNNDEQSEPVERKAPPIMPPSEKPQEEVSQNEPEAPAEQPAPAAGQILTPPPPEWLPPELGGAQPAQAPSPQMPQTPEPPTVPAPSTPATPADSEPPIPEPEQKQPEMPPRGETLADLEAAVGRKPVDGADVDSAREEVNRALSGAPTTPEPIQALNANPLGNNLHPTEPGDAPVDEHEAEMAALNLSTDPNGPGQVRPPENVTEAPKLPDVKDPNAPPPVPPPFNPAQFGVSTPPQEPPK